MPGAALPGKMERVLEKSEKDVLLEMLEVNSLTFSNYPMMKQAYKRASKKYHPDKGGSNEQMMLLNSLWQKYQEGIIDIRNSQVCAADLSDLEDLTLGEYYGHRYRDEIIKSPQCLAKGKNNCKCITSILYNQHLILKRLGLKPCLQWGECYCFACFALWFGLSPSWESFEVWIAILEETPRALLQLDEIGKYLFSLHASNFIF